MRFINIFATILAAALGFASAMPAADANGVGVPEAGPIDAPFNLEKRQCRPLGAAW